MISLFLFFLSPLEISDRIELPDSTYLATLEELRAAVESENISQFNTLVPSVLTPTSATTFETVANEQAYQGLQGCDITSAYYSDSLNDVHVEWSCGAAQHVSGCDVERRTAYTTLVPLPLADIQTIQDGYYLIFGTSSETFVDSSREGCDRPFMPRPMPRPNRRGSGK